MKYDEIYRMRMRLRCFGNYGYVNQRRAQVRDVREINNRCAESIADRRVNLARPAGTGITLTTAPMCPVTMARCVSPNILRD